MNFIQILKQAAPIRTPLGKPKWPSDLFANCADELIDVAEAADEFMNARARIDLRIEYVERMHRALENLRKKVEE